MKMLVSDFDRTFYINDIDIEINKEYVDKFRKMNNIFLFATGRCYASFMNVKRKFNLEYDYLILDHGSLIMDNNDNILYKYTLDNNLLYRLLPYLSLDKCDCYYFCSLKEKIKEINNNEITKIYLRYNNKMDRNNVFKIINDKFKDCFSIYYLSNNAIEIVSKMVNKSYAIDKLINIIKVNKSDVYTIGDGYTDIEMIKNYNGYMISNGIKELESVAWRKVDSVSLLLRDIM